MAKFQEQAVVVSQEKLSEGIYSLWIQTDKIAGEAKPGQFLSLYTDDDSRLLPRPISICEIDREQKRIRMVYRIAGEGTAEFSGKQPGDTIRVLGPLGNGFPKKGKKAMLFGGGIGVPPMLQLAKELTAEGTEVQIVSGYRNADLFLDKELAAAGTLYIATEDGSVGTKGNVMDAVREHALTADVIMACGPKPMLRAIKAYALEHGIECYISMEERMACGIGACLGCICQSTEVDDHSHVKNKRICADGPVFLSTEVEL